MKTKLASVTLTNKVGTAIEINLKKIVALGDMVRALNHPTRLKILETIGSAGEIAVKPLYKKLKIEQSVCSQFLKFLRTANLVTTRQDGKSILYSLNAKAINNLNRAGALALAAED